MKPVVGVMPLWDEKKDSIWMLPGYMDGIIQAGALPVIFPFLTDLQELRQLAAMCDGFVFTGGHDVSPFVYREEPLEDLIECCEMRDVMEGAVLKEALRLDKPVLGICRGLQFINAALGGTLYQDLPSQHPSDVNHRQAAPYDIPSHAVHISAGTPLRSLLEAEQIQVNSCHHQAVKALSPLLREMAISPDGLIEAAFKPDSRFVWAIQWHPEFSFRSDENSRKIFKAFTDALSPA